MLDPLKAPLWTARGLARITPKKRARPRAVQMELTLASRAAARLARPAPPQVGEGRSAIFSTEISCRARPVSSNALMLAMVVSAMLSIASAVKNA